MQLDILGYYGAGNCGDDALQEAMTDLFKPYANLNFPHAADESSATPLILGGGDVIKPYFLDRIPKKKKFYAFGVGLGYDGEMDLLYERRKELQTVHFRNDDDYSHALARGLSAHMIPDLAFILGKKVGHKKRPERKRLGIMVADNVSSSWSQKDPQQIGYGMYLKSVLAETVEYLSEWYEVLFIPMCDSRYARDIKMIHEIQSYMSPKAKNLVTLDTILSPISTIEMIQECSLLLTMRFHGNIFGMIAGTPTINIGITKKTAVFQQENSNVTWGITPYSITKDSLLEKVKLAEEVYENKFEEFQENVKSKTDRYISLLERSARILIEDIKSNGPF